MKLDRTTNPDRAGDALAAYAVAALIDDPEYATEIVDMQRRAGRQSPLCKRPD